MSRRKPRATTAEILNPASNQKPARARVPTKWRRHFSHLVRLRQRLVSRQGDLTRDALQESPSFSMHMADAGTDTFDRDFTLGMLSTEQDAVYQIDQAIDRIRNGGYGICELTGKRIEAARLEAVPWTRFCAAAERQLEKDGRAKHAALGQRETVRQAELPRPAGEEAEGEEGSAKGEG